MDTVEQEQFISKYFHLRTVLLLWCWSFSNLFALFFILMTSCATTGNRYLVKKEKKNRRAGVKCGQYFSFCLLLDRFFFFFIILALR